MFSEFLFWLTFGGFALAILLDYTNDPDFALRHYQDFKWDG